MSCYSGYYRASSLGQLLCNLSSDSLSLFSLTYYCPFCLYIHNVLASVCRFTIFKFLDAMIMLLSSSLNGSFLLIPTLAYFPETASQTLLRIRTLQFQFYFFFEVKTSLGHLSKNVVGIELDWRVTLVRVKSDRITAIWIGDRYMGWMI